MPVRSAAACRKSWIRLIYISNMRKKNQIRHQVCPPVSADGDHRTGHRLFVLLTFVIPKLQSCFPGQCRSAFTDTRSPWPWYKLLRFTVSGSGGLALLIVGLRFFLKTERGKYMRDALILPNSLVGSLFHQGHHVRFASISHSAVQRRAHYDLYESIVRHHRHRAIAAEFERSRERMQEEKGYRLHSARQNILLHGHDMIAIRGGNR